MAPRAFWKGTIRLSLVSVPVRLHPATSSSQRLSLHMIHAPTGERVRYQQVVPEVGAVEKEEIVKGYEYERGHYVTFTDKELDKIKVESKHTINLVRFVDAGDIDPIYFDRPYFVAPDSELAEEPFIVLRDALKATRKVALGQVTLAGKEHIAAIRPCGRGLVLETLRFAEEVRAANTFFDEIPQTGADAEQLELARLLIDKKSGAFDPHEFKNQQQEVLKQMIAAKVQDRPMPTAGEPKATAKIINLMDALRRSVNEAEKESGARQGKNGPPAAKAAKKNAGKTAEKGTSSEPPAAAPSERRRRRGKS